jgi:hypothetical protein
LGPLRLAQIAAPRRCDVHKSVIGRDLAVAVDEALKSITTNATQKPGLENRLVTRAAERSPW